jgi:beta-glucanase (GH16 family)
MKKALCRIPFMVLFLFMTNAFSSGGWKLSWSDEFDSTALNEKNWNVQVANPGWVNSEQEAYTAGHDKAGSNIFVANGNLNIFALKSASGGITSGRIYSQNKQFFQYGRMEARMRLPITQGYWPAFWMLGTVGGWPGQGEIDIMEGQGQNPNWTSGSYHSSGFDQTKSYTMPTSRGNLHDSFHIYAVEWSADSIRWYFDTVNFEVLTVAAHPGIPITNNYYFIFNVAVGGNFVGNYNSTTVFPESLIVDYVRVYKWDPTLAAESPAQRPATGQRPVLTNCGGRLSVALPEAQRYSAEIASVNGQRVLTRSGEATFFSVETSALAPGVYIATVRGRFGTLTDRFVVRR